MVVEVVVLLAPEPAPTEPALVPLPALVSVLEVVSVPVEVVSVPVLDPEPELVSDPLLEPTVVPVLVFPLGATVIGAAAEPAM
jgi:hypothetical protein